MHRHHLKLREFGDKDIVELGVRIVAWSKLLGITNKPNNEDVEYTVDFLRKHYWDFCSTEISYALELNLTGALGIKTESYQAINIPYLTKILNSYRTYRQKQLAIETQNEKNEAQNEINKIPNEQEIIERQLGNYQKLIEIMAEKGELPIFWGWVDVYLHMEREGFISLSIDEKFEWALEVKAKAIKEIDRTKEKDLFAWRKNMEKLNNGELFANLCREEYIKKIMQERLL